MQNSILRSSTLATLALVALAATAGPQLYADIDVVQAVVQVKVPVPFLNKGPSRSAEQDAAETRKNRDWDPNAPLYGKNPAKPLPAPAAERVRELAATYDVDEVMVLMRTNQVRRVLVTEDGRLVGVIALADLVRVAGAVETLQLDAVLESVSAPSGVLAAT